MFKIIDNKIRLSLGRGFYKETGYRYLYLDIPKNIEPKSIRMIYLLPKFNGLWFEVAFVCFDDKVNVELDKTKYLGIDLGIDNFATCVDTNGTSFIIEGRHLKSLNRWFNKVKAKLQSIYKKQKIKTGRKLVSISKKRSYWIDNFMNQAVNIIIKYCISDKIGTIVIGSLKNAKHEINIGKINNQNFVSIPYNLFKRKLKAKCEKYGIEYIEVDESYTSQTCSSCGTISKSNRIYRADRIIIT
jgi:IS605 OrfB family transposase